MRKFSKLNLYDLIVFYFVISEGGLTSAAECIFLSEPTVIHHIRKLEKSAGIKLLYVKRQRVFPTKAGEVLFRYAEEIYEQVSKAQVFLQHSKEDSLCIGVDLTFSQVVALIAARFEELFPHVKLRIVNGSCSEITRKVLDLQVDLGIVCGRDYVSPKLEHIEVSAGEKLVLVTSPSSPISRKEQVMWADLCGYPLILGPEGSATRQVLLEKFEAKGLKMESLIVVEVNHVECGKSLVEERGGHNYNVHKECGKRSL